MFILLYVDYTLVAFAVANVCLRFIACVSVRT